MGMNDLDLGFGLGEKMGLSPTQVNTAATGVSAYGNIANAALEFASIWTDYYNAKFGADMQHASAQMMRDNAPTHLEDAREAMRMAGRVQQTGTEAATNRYLQLGQDIGHVYAGAAGSGIDVSSATVRNVDRSMRLMANRDVAAIGRTAAENARQYARQASAHRRAYTNDLVKANLTDIQADYSKRAALNKAHLGTASAAMNNLGALALLALL